MGYIDELLKQRGLTGIFSVNEMVEFESLVMHVDTNIDISSVILSNENKLKLTEFIAEQDNRDKLLAHRLVPMNRLLFYGASGTGKTYLTKALSNYMGYSMLYVDIAKSLSDGSVSKNISNVFKLANRVGRCFIFFDEADSIAWNRDSTSPDSGLIRRATNSLFQNLDQMGTNNVFISATNLLHRLDPAFERRFNLKFEFRRPNNIEYAIKKFIYDEFELVDDIDKDKKRIIENRAESSPKLSYYEIQGVVERAMKKAVMSDTNKVRLSVIYEDIARTERIKVYFKTDKDNEKIFKSSIV